MKERRERFDTYRTASRSLSQNQKQTMCCFDCSAKYKGTCLNDHFLPGPNITNSLLSVLLSFRCEYVAIQGDIKGMFLQVKIPPTSRD